MASILSGILQTKIEEDLGYRSVLYNSFTGYGTHSTLAGCRGLKT